MLFWFRQKWAVSPNKADMSSWPGINTFWGAFICPEEPPVGRGSALLHTTLCPNVVTRNLASALLCSGLPPTRGGADLWEMGRGEAQFCYLFHSFRCISTFPVRSKVRQRYESKDGRGWGRKRRDLESYSLIPILILIADLEKMFGRVSEGWKNFRGSRGPNKYFFTSLPMSYFSNQTYLLYTVTDQAIVDMKETCQM